MSRLASTIWRAILRIHARLDGFPSEFAGCRLIFAEKTFSTDQPIHLKARVDRAYETTAGLALIEFKSRYSGHVHAMDIIELSSQRIVIQRQTGLVVCDYGYVLLQHPSTGRRTLRRIDLLPEPEVLRIAIRRSQILAGALPPRSAADPACCARCEYRRECTMRRV